MKTAKVKDYPNLVKTGPAVINTDRRAYEAALLRQAKAKKEKGLEMKVNSLESTVNLLENKIDLILELLRNRDANNKP